MAIIPGTVGVTGIVAPKDSEDTYAVGDVQYIKGASIQAINLSMLQSLSIVDRLSVGQLAVAIDTGKLYRLDVIGPPNTWTEVVGGETETYQNALPTIAAVGGISAGSNFFNTPKSYAEFAEASFYPYQSPAFTSFSIQGQSNPLEVGDSISGLKTFSWGTSNSSNVQTNSINIYKVTGGLAPLLTGLANDGSEGYTFPSPIQLVTAGSYVWRIEGTNTQLETFTRDFTENWYWRKFWGTNASTTLTEAQIEALVSQSLSSATAGNYSFSAVAGQYKYFAFQKDLPQPDYLTDFKDQSTGFNVAMESPYLVTVTNSFSVATDYYVYRTTNQLGGAMTIVVTN